MLYNEYENYYEPSVLDEIGNKFKEELIAHLKQEIAQDINNKDKQIKMLKQSNEKIKQELNQLRQEKMKYGWKIEELEFKWNSMKIKDFLKNFTEDKFEAWQVNFDYKFTPKCNKCDSDRYIHFFSPSGKECKERCLCYQQEKIYKPIKTNIKSLSISFNKNKNGDKDLFAIYYKNSQLYDDNYYSGRESITFDLIKMETKFHDNNNDVYRTYLTEEECQKHCDYLNSKSK